MAIGGGSAGAPRAKDVSKGAAGRYSFLAEVARGYLGTLWLAHDPSETPDRPVFVRHVAPIVAASARAALLDGARWAEAGDNGGETIESKNALDVVTPFLDAEPLRALLRTAALKHATPSPAVVLGIVRALCTELTVLHESLSPHAFGGVHPDSIFLGMDGKVHLVDVGISAVASSREPWRSDPQRVGYFAPEQLDPRGVADARTDVFAIGVLLWEALANRRLFPGNDAKTVRERVQKGPIARLDATRPSAAAGIATDIADLVARTLERSAAERHQTLAELRRAVSALDHADASAIGAWVTSLADVAIAKRRQLLERSGVQAPSSRAGDSRGVTPDEPDEEASHEEPSGGSSRTSAPPRPGASLTPAPPGVRSVPPPKPGASLTPAPPSARSVPPPKPGASLTPAPPGARSVPPPKPGASLTPAPPGASPTPAPPGARPSVAPPRPGASLTPAPPGARPSVSPPKPGASLTPAPPGARSSVPPPLPGASLTPAPPGTRPSLPPRPSTSASAPAAEPPPNEEPLRPSTSSPAEEVAPLPEGADASPSIATSEATAVAPPAEVSPTSATLAAAPVETAAAAPATETESAPEIESAPEAAPSEGDASGEPRPPLDSAEVIDDVSASDTSAPGKDAGAPSRPLGLPQPARSLPPRPPAAAAVPKREHAGDGMPAAATHDLASPIQTTPLATLTAAPSGRSERWRTPAMAALVAVVGIGGWWLGRSRPAAEPNGRSPSREERTSQGATAKEHQPAAEEHAAAAEAPSAAPGAATSRGAATNAQPAPGAPEATAEPVAAPSATAEASAAVATGAAPGATGTTESGSAPAEAPKQSAPATASAGETAPHRPSPSRSLPNSGYKPGGI